MTQSAPSSAGPEPRQSLHRLISAWLIPAVPPPPWLCALATLIATLAAIIVRISLLGLTSGVGVNQSFFPAMVLVTLYAGWRWGLVPVLSGALFAWWLWGGRYGQMLNEDQIATEVLYLLSSAVTVAVAHGLRTALVELAEVRRRQTDAEARLEVTQAAAGVGAWDWDVAAGTVSFSPTARRNLGIVGEGPVDLDTLASRIHPDDIEQVRAAMRSAVKAGSEYEVEYRLLDLATDGEYWIHGRGEVRRDANGRAVRIVGVNLDISKRRRAEESLRESEARFRALANSAPALMWITGTDGAREFVNDAYRAFTGGTYDEALALDWRTRLDPEDLPAVLKAQIAGEASRKPFNLTGRYRRADGQMRWLQSFSQPRFGPRGAFEGFAGIAFDVTEAKAAQAKLTGLNELLAERVQAALAERDAAQAALSQAQKLDALGQLTGGVAHDFNNLLTVIIGALDVVERHPADAVRRGRMIGAAQAAARRGEKLTQHLLAFARRQPLNPQVCRVDAVIADSESLLRRAVGEGVTLTLRLGAGTRAARMDLGQFEAALLNLVVNARDATPSGGEIAIESGPVILTAARGELQPGGYLRVAVRDSGQGMDPETIARAFEPFYTTKAVDKGTGLGLSQVYGFVRQSGGEVSIESSPGLGTTVTLLLPACEALPPEAAPRASPPGDRPPAHVLLVEDDIAVGELVETMLRELGHSVTRAGTVDEALARAQADPTIAFVLTDVIMPGGKSGVDLASALTAQRPDLPVLLSSGYTGQELETAHAAPWPLLRKPYALSDLAQAMADVWDQRPTSQAAG